MWILTISIITNLNFCLYSYNISSVVSSLPVLSITSIDFSEPSRKSESLNKSVHISPLHKTLPCLPCHFPQSKSHSCLNNLTLLSDLIYYSSQVWCLCSGHSGLTATFFELWDLLLPWDFVLDCLHPIFTRTKPSLPSSVAQWSLPWPFYYTMKFAHLICFILLYIFIFFRVSIILHTI